MTTRDKLSVLITTSGIGSRLGNFTKYSNKCLVKVGDLPVITRIIETYPKGTSFYITLGHNGHLVKQYLTIAHGETDFTYIEVDKYMGDGSSLAYSLLQAEPFLRKPFIYHACDTLVEKYSPSTDLNWVGGYKKTNSAHYATINVEGGIVKRINPKGEINYDYEYIGLAGVHDYELFWKTLGDIYASSPGDSSLNDSIAINEMLNTVSFSSKVFHQWRDIGNTDSLNAARKAYPSKHTVLDKDNEAIYFLDGKVVKFFSSAEVNRKRVERMKNLGGLIPRVLSSSENFYSYEYTPANLAADFCDDKMIFELLEWSKDKLWTNTKNMGEAAKRMCREFYYDKTLSRVEMLLSQINKKSSHDTINGELVPSVKEMLCSIEEGLLLTSELCNFHGDFILDNILVTEDGFSLIDWRQDFAGDINNGDVYYDLAKLNHNLFFNHHNIEAGLFEVRDSNGKVFVDLKMNHRLYLAKKAFDEWCVENKYDVKKINILTSIIWVNMAPLHTYPLNKFLFYFGKYNLYREIR